jgi:HlyD family secretion protein
MTGKLLAILGAIILAAGGGLAYWFVAVNHQQADNTIRLSGNIEVTDAEVSFKIPGRVEQRFVDEGQSVDAGKPIARLDDSDLRAEVALHRAELEAAQAVLSELKAGTRPEDIEAARAAMQRAAANLQELEAGSRPQEIAAAQAALSAAQAELARAQSDYNRASQLIKEKSISQEEFERSRAAFEVASQRAREASQQFELIKEGARKERIEQARAALAEAKARYDLAVAGPRKQTIEQAGARVAQAEAALGLAETRLGYAEIFAPLSGRVLSKNIEPGEYVAPGTPVVTIGDLVHVWLRAYVNETDLGKVKPGQTVRVTTDTYPGKVYEGRIAFIADQSEFTPKSVQTEQQRVKLVYRVKIDITNPNMELKPGMPADATISLQPEAESQSPGGLADK